ncbi:hypothetical protein JMJ35_006054 [Cladonia borealis]|uniref:Uncharacterized protein n=1 Tax=Cladonia borealis TaxID=184061 RepID=A0AA39U9M7_9LECA|nr:hypothetical protein JMJ35_006054 [Cladonia borealis]
MPTNRPFFANFLAAFRAHSAISKSTTTATTTSTSSTAASAFSPQSLTSRPLTTKAASPSTTTAAVQAASHLRHPSTGPARSPPSNFSRPQRRGSDSSSEGFRDLGEKWYVGGRTANGEERFYKLGMVRRERSGDRLSLDRLSI